MSISARAQGMETTSGAHGYLLNEFLSPLTNHRSDEYGGDFNRRLRLPLEIVRAIRAAIGQHALLLYRLGASDFHPDGLTMDEGCQAAKALATAGVDLLDVSGGLCGSQPPSWDGKSQGYFVPLAAAVRAEAYAAMYPLSEMLDKGSGLETPADYALTDNNGSFKEASHKSV